MLVFDPLRIERDVPLARPEPAPADDRQHRGEQCEAHEERARDADGAAGAHRADRPDVREQEDEQRERHREAARQDRRTGAPERDRHRLALVLVTAELLPIAGHEQQAVVGPHPEHQDDEDPGGGAGHGLAGLGE